MSTCVDVRGSNGHARLVDLVVYIARGRRAKVVDQMDAKQTLKIDLTCGWNTLPIHIVTLHS